MKKQHLPRSTRHKSVVDRCLLTTEELARYTGISASSLTKWRLTGGGPKFVRLGTRVAYRPIDIDDWLEARLCKSTSEYIPF